MRGTGYAIGEILIFLAVAAIIGFLIGWLVFYRRSGQTSTQLSPVNPNHVKRLEERSRAVDGKLVRIEKRANALLEALAKAPRPGATAAVEAAPMGEVAAASDPRIPAPGKDKTKAKAKDETEAGTQQAADTKEKTKAKAEDQTEAGTQQAADTKDKTKAKAEDQTEAGTQQAADTRDEARGDVDDYLSEADERISKLEDTLEKLSKKLAELSDD